MRRESGDRDWLEHLLKKGKPLHEAENTEEARERLRELAGDWLKIRNRNGEHVALVPNRAQLEFEKNRGQKNIVLKARQMGISTWVSARFFLKPITR
jgi:hypothetical protein